MNLILIEKSDFVAPDRVRLRPHQVKHVRETLCAQSGDSLRIGLINGLMGSGTISKFESDLIEVDVELSENPPPPLHLTLYLALPRPKFLAKILQTTTSMGVKHIYLFNSYKVEKVYWHCEQITPLAMRESCLLGLEQARDTVLPEIHQRRLFKPFVEDELPSLVQGTRALIAHPTATLACPYGIAKPDSHVSLAIGPEGGFIDYEVEKLNSAGFETVHLSERILKVETAVTALISRLT